MAFKPLELGDTGTVNVRGHKDGVIFTVQEGAKNIASCHLDRERSIYIIKSLCKLLGVETVAKKEGIL